MEAPGPRTPSGPLPHPLGRSSPSPKKWDGGAKVLTRLCADYSCTLTNIDKNLMMVDDWEALKNKALLRKDTPPVTAGCWAQVLRGKGFKAPGQDEEYEGDRVSLFLDLDDRLPTHDEAVEKTREMVKWAQEELPALLEPYGVNPTPAWVKGNIAISVMPGQDPDYKRDIAKLREKGGNVAAEKLREKGGNVAAEKLREEGNAASTGLSLKADQATVDTLTAALGAKG